MNVTKITADEAQVGEFVSRRKKGPFFKVAFRSTGPKSVYLFLDGHGRIRPRRSAVLWRAT